MPFSRNDAETLRDAIQRLFVHASNRPLSIQERRDSGVALRTIERLTDSPIPVPGRDSAKWTFRLRLAAWNVYGYALASNGTRPVKAIKYLQKCQDTLRCVPTAGNDDRGGMGRRDNAEGNAILVEYLSKHPDAAEDDALSAVNAALPTGAKPWTLVALRKNGTWREHIEKRIGEYMDRNQDASLERIGKNVGYAKSTVSNSAAYQARREKRKAAKPPSKGKIRGNVTDRQLACMELGKQLPRDPERDAIHAEAYATDGNTLTDPNAFRSLLLNIFEDSSEYRVKVNRLTDKQLLELLQYVKENINPNETELLQATVEQWFDDRSRS